MAKGHKTSLAVRALALLFALALAALAGWLWLRGAPQETSASDAASASGEARDGEAEDAISREPPLHEEHSAKDQEALRGILRGAESETP